MDSVSLHITSLPGWKGTSGPPVTSTATTPANWKRICIDDAMNPNKIKNKKQQNDQNLDSFLIPHLIEISIWQDVEPLLDGLQESDSNIKTIVCIVSKLSCMLHCSKWTTSLCLNIIGSSRMPSATAKSMKRHAMQLSVLSNHDIFKPHVFKTIACTYANRSISGAQFLSAMNPLSFLLHFSIAFLYSSLTLGYDFPMLNSYQNKQKTL